MKSEDIASIEHIRSIVFSEIKRQLEIDSHCKSYEGIISIQYPSFFGGDYVLRLDCYVIGPSRHYEWAGDSVASCCDKALKDIRKWIDDSTLEQS